MPQYNIFESAKQNAMAAHEQRAAGPVGDPDPVVFPGQKLARLSQYVMLMKDMQRGDMMGALERLGLDMGSYGQVAQAIGESSSRVIRHWLQNSRR